MTDATASDRDETFEPSLPRRWRGVGRAGTGLIVPALGIAVWQAVASAGLVDPTLLPTPTRVIGELGRLALSGELVRHLGISLQRVVLGFLGGTGIAVVVGALTGYSARWRALLDPALQALRTVPGLAWIPMFILWFGIDEGSKVGLIGLATFFPTYLNFMAGIARTDRRLIEVGRVNRLSGTRLVATVLLPNALPNLFIGLRQSMGVAWIVVVAAELMGASSGIGYLLMDGEMTGRPHVVIACMIVFALSGKTTDTLLAALSNRLLRWQDTEDRD
ncbi:ABC transporter permease [Siculibacillus lacustris]|uniref:ABC transporter permease n=1 Tax=Siculibacillus lacustris TaxID=1549641 RepID=A0A4Q9VJM5_9HYPH|nr:ABC transporter permease [Siculibacillus lacustris]TBW35530.1 ABC transporter permease [Siculibacillus lacustris]